MCMAGALADGPLQCLGAAGQALLGAEEACACRWWPADGVRMRLKPHETQQGAGGHRNQTASFAAGVAGVVAAVERWLGRMAETAMAVSVRENHSAAVT